MAEPYWNRREALAWIAITGIVTTYLVCRFAFGVDILELGD
jgi:hypothetical protein